MPLLAATLAVANFIVDTATPLDIAVAVLCGPHPRDIPAR
jgi:hypothetical protein